METYRLGDIRNAVPPPPDWQRAIGQIPPWRRAVAVPNLDGLPFLNHAVFCWAGRVGDDKPDLGVYLFRQSFSLQQPETIARATLRVAANVEVLDGAFNEHPLHLAGAKKMSIVEYEVTPLVRGGDNLVALKVRGRPGVLSANFGLAFNLEIQRRRDVVPLVPALDPKLALLLGRGGDRVWGSVQELREDRIVVSTRYGHYSMGWDECAELLFPAGWQAPRPEPGLKEKLFQNVPVAVDPELPLNAMPLATLPRPLDNCLLLTEGRLTSAKPSYVSGGKLFFDGAQGKQVSLPLEEVLGIIPPRPAQQTVKRPPRAVAILYCQVATRTGEVFSGLLRQISPETVILETGGGRMLEIRTDNTATIEFPYHATFLTQEESGRGEVGVLAPTSEDARMRSVFEDDARDVQAAGYAIGAECHTLTLEEMANENMLRPARYPVLVSIDPVGHYLHSYFGGADAQQALMKYLDGGGVVVALSRGGAFRTPMEHQGGGKLAPAQAKPALAEALGLATLRPSEKSGSRVSAFSSPPNEGGEFFFERAGDFPSGLKALPGRIELAPMLSAPFYPMVASGGKATVLYSLADARGRFYGPALSLVPHGRGWLVVIDDLLWESRVDGRPFTERVLPVLLKWAISAK
jgi:hypothetical protein